MSTATEKVLATFGNYQAVENMAHRQFHVRDTRTGVTFGANSRAHAIDKAKKLAK